jgi:hypothetical protein
MEPSSISVSTLAAVTSEESSGSTEAARASFDVSPQHGSYDTYPFIPFKEDLNSGETESPPIPVAAADTVPSTAEKLTAPYESTSPAVRFREQEPETRHPQYDMGFDPLRGHLAYCARRT